VKSPMARSSYEKSEPMAFCLRVCPTKCRVTSRRLM